MSEESTAPIRIVVGLGNPGKKYLDTRHNIGFMILDELVRTLPETWATEKKWKTKVIRHEDVFYLKPQTFMNASGDAVAAVANFYKIAPEQILVVYDDLDLELDRLRFRKSGSAGGHNGIKSLIARLGGQEFPRLKIGIGRGNAKTETIGHVLGKFAPDEQEKLEKSLQEAVLAVECALSRGLDLAMNQFNRKPEKPKKKKATPKEQLQESGSESTTTQSEEQNQTDE